MNILIYVKFYNKKDIDNFIEKYPKSKVFFEKCGLFLADKYLIIDNEFQGYRNPYTQLKYLIIDMEATEKNIDLETYEEIDDYDSEILDDFLNIEYTCELSNYVEEI